MTHGFSLYTDLKSRIDAGEAKVGTIGLGYVGLPLALTAHDGGYPVTGFDVNKERVASINAGEQVISYFAKDRISTAIGTGTFEATADMSRLSEMDVILLCVPTPLGDDRQPDMTYVKRAGDTLAAHLRPGQLVVLESTVWPGATSTVLQPILERAGLKAGTHFFLGFSPEREDPGNENYNTRTIPKIVGADDDQSRDLMEMFYNRIVTKAVPVSSSATAEAVKLTENSFRTVNIALVNEMKAAYAKMGVDIWEVVEAAATKPFGYMPFYPGPGIGGDCIPVSPVFISWRARDVGAALPMVELASASNEEMPTRVAGSVAEAVGGDLTDKKILILGISYKKDIEDTRESPALAALQVMEGMGAKCDYHDPYFAEMPVTRDHPDLAGRTSVALSEAAVASYDVVLVTTDHTGVNYPLVARSAKAIVDTRNVFAKLGIDVPGDRLTKG